MLIEIIAIVFLLLISAFFSSSETAITRASDAKIHQKADEGNIKAIHTKKLLKDREKVIGALLLGNNAVNILASALATSLLIAPFGDVGIVYATILMTILIFIFSEVLPKTYAIRESEKLTLYSTPYIKFITMVLAPVNNMVQIFVSFILNFVGRENNRSDWKQSIRGAIILANDEGGVRKRDRKMLEGILDLNEISVSEIMTHRKNIESLNVMKNKKVLANFAIKSRFSRIPIWKNNPDNIIGILHIKDLTRSIWISEDLNIEKILQKPLFIPETTSLSIQLNQFRQSSIQMALVVDEYGVLQGLITLEDILEEIVGDITDEFDDDENFFSVLDEHSFIFEGKISLNDFLKTIKGETDYFDDIKGDADTLAGLVLELKGGIPNKGEIIKFNPYTFIIESSDKRKIKRIKVQIQKDE